MRDFGLGVVYDSFRWHVAIHHSEGVRFRRPRNVVYRTLLVWERIRVKVILDEGLLTKLNPRIETSIGAEQVQCRLTVVVLICLVDFSLSKYDQASAVIVPLELDLIALEEVLL